MDFLNQFFDIDSASDWRVTLDTEIDNGDPPGLPPLFSTSRYVLLGLDDPECWNPAHGPTLELSIAPTTSHTTADEAYYSRKTSPEVVADVEVFPLSLPSWCPFVLLGPDDPEYWINWVDESVDDWVAFDSLGHSANGRPAANEPPQSSVPSMYINRPSYRNKIISVEDNIAFVNEIETLRSGSDLLYTRLRRLKYTALNNCRMRLQYFEPRRCTKDTYAAFIADHMSKRVTFLLDQDSYELICEHRALAPDLPYDCTIPRYGVVLRILRLQYGDDVIDEVLREDMTPSARLQMARAEKNLSRMRNARDERARIAAAWPQEVPEKDILGFCEDYVQESHWKEPALCACCSRRTLYTPVEYVFIPDTASPESLPLKLGRLRVQDPVIRKHCAEEFTFRDIPSLSGLMLGDVLFGDHLPYRAPSLLPFCPSLIAFNRSFNMVASAPLPSTNNPASSSSNDSQQNNVPVTPAELAAAVMRSVPHGILSPHRFEHPRTFWDTKRFGYKIIDTHSNSDGLIICGAVAPSSMNSNLECYGNEMGLNSRHQQIPMSALKSLKNQFSIVRISSDELSKLDFKAMKSILGNLQNQILRITNRMHLPAKLNPFLREHNKTGMTHLTVSWLVFYERNNDDELRTLPDDPIGSPRHPWPMTLADLGERDYENRFRDIVDEAKSTFQYAPPPVFNPDGSRVHPLALSDALSEGTPIVAKLTPYFFGIKEHTDAHGNVTSAGSNTFSFQAERIQIIDREDIESFNLQAFVAACANHTAPPATPTTSTTPSKRKNDSALYNPPSKKTALLAQSVMEAGPSNTTPDAIASDVAVSPARAAVARMHLADHTAPAQGNAPNVRLPKGKGKSTGNNNMDTTT